VQLTQLRLQLPADTQWRWSCCACRHSAVSTMSSYSPVVLTTCTVLTALSLWVHRRLSSLTLTLGDCDAKESVERMLIAAVQRVWSTEWNSSWKNVTEWLKMRTIWHQRSVRFLLCFAILRHIHTLYPGLPRWAGTGKVKPVWILLKQDTVSGSGISWAICKSAPHSRQKTIPPLSFFTGWMPFLPPNQQCQSTEGTLCHSEN